MCRKMSKYFDLVFFLISYKKLYLIISDKIKIYIVKFMFFYFMSFGKENWFNLCLMVFRIYLKIETDIPQTHFYWTRIF